MWAYHHFGLSTADVEDLLAERGVIVSREVVRLWVNRFGRHFANCIRRDRPKPDDKRHMDEAVITIGGRKLWLWGAIDTDGDVLDIQFKDVATRRLQSASSSGWSGSLASRVVVMTAKLGSYVTPIRSIAPDADHRAHRV